MHPLSSGVGLEVKRLSSLPKVGVCRISRNGQTLVITIDESKVYLLSVEGVMDLAGGYRDSVAVVEGRVLESYQKQ